MIIMNEERFVHYDPLKIENIFLSTLVHWFFCQTMGYQAKSHVLECYLEAGHNKQFLGVARWTTTRVKLRMWVLCYEVHNQLL
jgi:hypothetical protein